ncbi:MAG: transcriptional regulator [Deltaproteobacteria bacterium]|nr:transcriptional regulator [Candidatus Desulfobacula maris]
MKKKRHTTNAVDILHRRYIGDDAERKASLQDERVNAEVARMIYELRKEAGIKQKELAELIGTTQSVISRLENADYDGHSLSMLSRIAKALNRRLSVSMPDKDKDAGTRRFVFQEVVRGLRKDKGLGIDKFAKKSGINRADVISIERNPDYKPSPLILHRLSKFYKISQRKLAFLAGAIKKMPPGVQAEASRFAAQSESFSKLTEQERSTLDEFVKFLRTEDSE